MSVARDFLVGFRAVPYAPERILLRLGQIVMEVMAKQSKASNTQTLVAHITTCTWTCCLDAPETSAGTFFSSSSLAGKEAGRCEEREREREAEA